MSPPLGGWGMRGAHLDDEGDVGGGEALGEGGGEVLAVLQLVGVHQHQHPREQQRFLPTHRTEGGPEESEGGGGVWVLTFGPPPVYFEKRGQYGEQCDRLHKSFPAWKDPL